MNPPLPHPQFSIHPLLSTTAQPRLTFYGNAGIGYKSNFANRYL
jgi:hypothetical protein